MDRLNSSKSFLLDNLSTILPDKFKLDQINIDNLIFSNMPSPEGWADVIKKALDKLNYNV